jgi:iron complex transport system substrate-binding protein
MMRQTLALLLLIPALALVACGEDEPEAAAPNTTTTTAEASAFPVTIEHKYGTTEIAEAPKRIVSVGYNEQDALWALGVAPVGVTDWMGFDDGIGPWATEAAAAAGAKPKLLKDTDGIQYEEIAALQPDVIVGLYTGMKRADYEKLSQIAPTVAPPEGTADWGIAWQDTTTLLGKVTGREEQAAKIISDLEARFAKEKEAHPEFAGKSAAMAMAFEGIWIYGENDPRSRLLASLGFSYPPSIASVVGDEYSKQISNERADLLDIDTVAWIGDKPERAKLERNRVYTKLPVHEQGRDFYIEQERPDRAMNAIGFQTPLSISQSLDVLVPAFAAALDEDPATTPLEGDAKG